MHMPEAAVQGVNNICTLIGLTHSIWFHENCICQSLSLLRTWQYIHFETSIMMWALHWNTLLNLRVRMWHGVAKRRGALPGENLHNNSHPGSWGYDGNFTLDIWSVIVMVRKHNEIPSPCRICPGYAWWRKHVHFKLRSCRKLWVKGENISCICPYSFLRSCRTCVTFNSSPAVSKTCPSSNGECELDGNGDKTISAGVRLQLAQQPIGNLRAQLLL